MPTEFKLAVNSRKQATELRLCRVCGSVQENPHMRAFWCATISFFLAFFGWFALAPLGLEVAGSMEICENQLYPVATHPTRRAYLKYENLTTGQFYCRFGMNDNSAPTDCLPGPAGTNDSDRYDASALSECVCTAGTHCRTTIIDAGVASVASTIFMRVALGTLLERFGPVNMQTCLMLFGGFWVAMAASIDAEWNFIVIRFFIGMVGATFVTNQFWCSLMFAPNVVGTANACAAGWGNLGGGVTQAFMLVGLFDRFRDLGMKKDVAWRISMLIPAFVFVIVGTGLKCLCWDTPTRRRFDPVVDTGKRHGASVMDYIECLKDLNVVVMIFQYSACFGTELAMNNQLATHFRTYFQMKATDASLLAACFGGMNLFARPLGGMASDFLFRCFGFRGRLWAQFVALILEAGFLFTFGHITNDQPWTVALAVLVCFSLFVQMAEGTTFGIVPFMSKTQLACVSALVGAGGNLGAVIASFGIYRFFEDDLLPFRVHAGYVIFWALLSPFYYWPEYGGMLRGPSKSPSPADIQTEADANTNTRRPSQGQSQWSQSQRAARGVPKPPTGLDSTSAVDSAIQSTAPTSVGTLSSRASTPAG